MAEKKPGESLRELENAEVSELEEGDLDSVAGGEALDNENCNNTDCCKTPDMQGVVSV